MDNLEPTFKRLLEKVNALRESGKYDLSMEEDLSIAVMNLISLEEHFFFTGEKTGKPAYFDWLAEVRDMRKKLLANLTGDHHEGETWCISKHLLAATMRLIETGTKLQKSGKKAEAQEVFGQAYKLYTLFWGVRLKLINTPKHSTGPTTYQDIMSELVDCCKE
jgi:rhamnogalacturonyl hydrolase YesR